MTELKIEVLENLFAINKENSLKGKWITFNTIKQLLDKHGVAFKKTKIGTSEENRPIYSFKIGTGSKKILLWSQMHGNESTGTKAMFDLFNTFSSTTKELQNILNTCTLIFIPMLNPDGAEVFTRVNANNIDLNRDAVDKKAKESHVLRQVLDNFKPQFCFNLHDQRTIFNVEGTKNPATLSFLAPSEDVTRALTPGRQETMAVIVSMNNVLQNILPNCIGRYTDEFYPTATGDNFQKLGYNTILIESGHYPKDYEREISRKYTFFAILQGLYFIANTNKFTNYKPYFNIPNNGKAFYDVIHRYENSNNDEAYQYKDFILDNKLVSKLEKVTDTELDSKHGHVEILFEK